MKVLEWYLWVDYPGDHRGYGYDGGSFWCGL